MMSYHPSHRLGLDTQRGQGCQHSRETLNVAYILTGCDNDEILFFFLFANLSSPAKLPHYPDSATFYLGHSRAHICSPANSSCNMPHRYPLRVLETMTTHHR